MNRITSPGTQDDDKVLDELFADVAPMIGDVVTSLLHAGKPLAVMGAMFERGFDGKVSGGVGHRAELARRVLSDARITEPVRARILDALKGAGGDELPVVLLVDRGEGLLAVRVRVERGQLSAIS